MKENEIYNVGSGEYLENMEIAKKLLKILDLDEDRLSKLKIGQVMILDMLLT